MKLDFSKLESVTQAQAAEDFTEQEQPQSGTNKLERAQQERKAIAATYQRQQDAIRKTEQLQHSLIKGLRGDAQPVDLLLQAVEIIGLMTGETVVLSGLAKEYAGRHGHADGGGCT